MEPLLDLTVSIRYHGPKAQNFFPGSSAGIRLLKEDLFALKLPHPKEGNIAMSRLPDGKGECTFMWPSAVSGGVLHKHLRTRIQGGDEAKQALLQELSVDRLAMKEKPVGGGPAYTHKQWRRPEPAVHPEPALRNEAQMLLDDMASSLKILKSETAEPAVPNLPHPAMAPSQIPAKPHPTRRDFGPPVSASSPRPSTPAPLAPSITPNMGVSSTYSRNVSPLPPASDSTPPSFIPSRKNSMQKTYQASPPRPPIVTPARPSRKRSHSPESWNRQTRFLPTAPKVVGGERVQIDSNPQVAQLTRELEELRRRTATWVAREEAILAELRTLDPSVHAEQSKELNESTMRSRIHEVESELAKERRLRSKAEATLADVERECKAPFVVPAMFEAFRMISEITTQAMEGPA